MQLDWIKYDTVGALLELQRVNLSQVDMGGVYIIWRAGTPPRAIRLGQGDIADRLGCHKQDSEVLAEARISRLYVTWAEVPVSARDAVECYLGKLLVPVVGDRFPSCQPLAVNLPFAA
jgi:hypothetical protein